jgi:hypothetical protein
LTLLQILPKFSSIENPHQTLSQSRSAVIFQIFLNPLKMAEEVGFEPTFLPTESVNGFRFIGKLTILRAVRQAEAERFWGL